MSILFSNILRSLSTRFKAVCLQRSLAYSMTKEKNSIVWIDLELTGLNDLQDHILEISCLITDGNLKITDDGLNIIIHHPENILRNMNPWSEEHHAESGLTNACRNSNVSLEEAENKILRYLKSHITPNTCPLAGNSVYMDRLFLKRHMPRIDEILHYRIIDVSTVKELCKRWHPTIFHSAPSKKLHHRSLSDIQESIKELQYYQKHMFK